MPKERIRKKKRKKITFLWIYWSKNSRLFQKQPFFLVFCFILRLPFLFRHVVLRFVRSLVHHSLGLSHVWLTSFMFLVVSRYVLSTKFCTFIHCLKINCVQWDFSVNIGHQSISDIFCFLVLKNGFLIIKFFYPYFWKTYSLVAYVTLSEGWKVFLYYSITLIKYKFD